MMMRHMWRYTTRFLHLYAHISVSGVVVLRLQTQFFILFLLWASCSSTFVANFWHEKNDGKTFPWRASHTAVLLMWERRAYFIERLLFTAAVISGNVFIPMLTTTIKILLMTSCAHSALKNSNFQHLPPLSRAKVANRKLCICWVREQRWKFSRLMASMRACSQQHIHTNTTHTPVSIRTANHSTQLLKFPQTPSSAAGGECAGWM